MLITFDVLTSKSWINPDALQKWTTSLNPKCGCHNVNDVYVWLWFRSFFFLFFVLWKKYSNFNALEFHRRRLVLSLIKVKPYCLLKCYIPHRIMFESWNSEILWIWILAISLIRECNRKIANVFISGSVKSIFHRARFSGVINMKMLIGLVLSFCYYFRSVLITEITMRKYHC